MWVLVFVCLKGVTITQIYLAINLEDRKHRAAFPSDQKGLCFSKVAENKVMGFVPEGLGRLLLFLG